MSKKSEKESVKQKETKKKMDEEKISPETSEKKPAKAATQVENQSAELKKLEEEVAKLKDDKLRLVAELKNEQKGFQRQMEQMYKYSNKKLN